MNKFGNLLWGLVLIVIGLIIGGNALGITDINVFFDALTRTGDIKYRVDGNHVILYK